MTSKTTDDVPLGKETAIYLSSQAHKPHWLGDPSDQRRRIKDLSFTKKLLKAVKLPGDEVIEVFESNLRAYNQLVFWADAHLMEEEAVDGKIVLETVVDSLSFIRPDKRSFNAGCQVSLWRDQSYPTTAGIPAFIFWERILPHFGAVVSDSSQTPQGRAFWQYQIKQALSKGLRVGGLHLENTNAMGKFKIAREATITKLSQTASFYGGEDNDTRLVIYRQ